ncbi:MAG TPA: ABC transporter ATP-binding protein, partial [Microbacterium ginsengisoli]|nr:ABC transporter ATP-binding protein [Microbacterium ginsengisoli]
MTSSLDARVVVRRDGFALDAALAVAPGETIAVMGPSGAGKSTLLGALAGLVPLDDGRIAVGGRELSTPARTVPPARRRMVLLSQDPHLFPHLSALDNVAFGPRARGVPRSVARARAQDWLDRLGVGAAASRRPDALSGGQRQRVALARAIVTEPDVLLLDE